MCSAYVELHAHSSFSYLDAASHPDELAMRAADLGYGSLALTDHNSLAGAMEFAQAARAHGIKPITGVEISVAANDGEGCERHVTLLAANQDGYRNICRLVTLAWAPRSNRWGGGQTEFQPRSADEMVATWSTVHPGKTPGVNTFLPGSDERPHPLVTLPQLLEHSEGVICLTGCATNGLLARMVTDGDSETQINRTLMQIVDAFGIERTFIEVQLSQQRGQHHLARQLVRIAERSSLRAVLTGNVHAHNATRARLRELLVARRLGVTVDACEAERAGNLALAMQTPEQRAAMAVPVVGHAPISASVEIADMIEFTLTSDLGYRYPNERGSSDKAINELAHICGAELTARYRGSEVEEARSRLQSELGLVERHGLAGFFLLHHEVMELARDAARVVRGDAHARSLNPPGRGRGSSVESIICYLTGLSHVDPLATNLTLGRFLNEELSSVPDIDLDFPRDIRHELLRRVVEKWGNRHVAMVCAHATWKRKGAIRDVGNALGLPQTELDRIARATSGTRGEEFWTSFDAATDSDKPAWQAFRQMVPEIMGLPRQMMQHSGGVVVSTDPLSDLVPIQPTAMPGRQMVQWDKDSCADAGFLKIDVLGLGMLSAVEECVDLVSLSGETIDLSRINYSDEKVFSSIQAGDTVGTFQIESRAQIQSIMRVKPENMHDLSVQVALIRPGPIIGRAVNPYIANRERRRVDPKAEITYDHPLLEPVLEETLGCIVWQDQVIGVAMAIAGFSAGEADALRRAMSRKRSAEAMFSHRERFIIGAQAQGVSAETATKIFDRLVGFASYGFPKAHSVAFAILAYQSAWLRQYWPAQFYTALLNAQPMGFYSPDTLLRDASRQGVGSAGPCVNRSSGLCVIEHLPRAAGIRVGLTFINGFSRDDAKMLTEARDDGGDFTDINDLAVRTRLPLHKLELLVASGATDCLPGDRRKKLWMLGLIEQPLTISAEDETTQLVLDLTPGYDDIPEFREQGEKDFVAADFVHTGLTTRSHPADLVRVEVESLTGNALPALSAVARMRDGDNTDVFGKVIARQRPPTAKGVMFLLLEDGSGTLNAIVPPQIYEDHRLVLRSGRSMLRLRGRVQRHGDVVNLIVDEIHRIPKSLQI